MGKLTVFALSTEDNPFDPFEQFRDWWNYDQEKGYQTCERFAKMLQVSPLMSEKEVESEKERAIDWFIENQDIIETQAKYKKVISVIESEFQD